MYTRKVYLWHRITYIVNPKCHSRSSSMAPVWLKVFVFIYIYIYIHILYIYIHIYIYITYIYIYNYIQTWMYIDHLWSQSWVSRPLCSGTLLQLPYTCIFFFSLFGCLCEKKWSQEKSTENPSDILAISLFHQRLLMRSPSLWAQLLVTGCFFFHSVPRKNYKNSEPVTWAWASTVPFRNTYVIV